MASRLDTPAQGLSSDQAKPLTAAVPMRTPVKEPGPTTAAKTSMSRGVRPFSASSASQAGRRVRLWSSMARDGTVEALTDEGGAAFGSAPVRVAVSGGVYQALLALEIDELGLDPVDRRMMRAIDAGAPEAECTVLMQKYQ